ncbi:MAG: KGK domain-containing protein [Thermostichales cyanobacterium BF4_bins_65]
MLDRYRRDPVLRQHDTTSRQRSLEKAISPTFEIVFAGQFSTQEVEAGFKHALRAASLLEPDDLLTLASSLITPKPDQQALQGAKWFQQGLPCQLLIPGEKTWRSGQVKLRVVTELIPDADPRAPSSASCLDDLR